MVFSSWPLAFCLRMYLPSDPEHHVPVLQGPGVQHGQTETSVDDVECHQVQTKPLKHLCSGDMSPPLYQVSVDIGQVSCGKPPVSSCWQRRESMFLHHRAGQTLPMLGRLLLLHFNMFQFCNLPVNLFIGMVDFLILLKKLMFLEQTTAFIVSLSCLVNQSINLLSTVHSETNKCNLRKKCTVTSCQ